MCQNQSPCKKEITTYINETRFGVLSYVRDDGTPLIRAMGSFAPAGLDIYFSTRKQAAKVAAITQNKKISFLFEHDNQELNQWKNILLIGNAEPVEAGPDLDKAVEILSNRNPRFKERIDKGELPQTRIFLLKTEQVEYLDYGKGFGHVEKITLQSPEPV